MSNPPVTDLLLVIGTSLKVQPAAMFPVVVHEKYHPVSIMINMEKTDYDFVFTYRLQDDIDTFFKNVSNKLSFRCENNFE